MDKKKGSALVVGAGISGIRSSLDLAEAGFRVVLIERANHPGGILMKLDHQFPTDGCGMCKMLPLFQRDSGSQYCIRKGFFHENIEIHLGTEISSIEGKPGDFRVALKTRPKWIDPVLCIGCGLCAEACPVEAADEFNENLSRRKAVYLPVPHGTPGAYVIDLSACTRCGKCEEVCPAGAVMLSSQEREKFKILVVDDELIVRDSIKDWLAEEGFSADTAQSGPDALEKLAQEDYHLMLMDIKMAEMDGVQVLKTVKEEKPEIEVVMMTAYATIDTAVEAMKLGARDYLVKPFDPDGMIPMIIEIFEEKEAAARQVINAGAIVLAGGTTFFNPKEGKNTFGYGIFPNVVTSIEFERILSNTGPFPGAFRRPGDEKPVKKIAWIQCVGSRDLQNDADFCSSICCMYAIKQACLAKEKAGYDIETDIFYMDMRTFGKTHDEYRKRAEDEKGVCLVRGRAHSLVQDEESNDLILRMITKDGTCSEKKYDMVVLSVGQRPSPQMENLAELTGISLNPWGFPTTQPFSLTRTDKEGVFSAGSFSGLADIGDSVIRSSAASLDASRLLHLSGGDLSVLEKKDELKDISKEEPRVIVFVCTCHNFLEGLYEKNDLSESIQNDPSVIQVAYVEDACSVEGRDKMTEIAGGSGANRVLIGACLSTIYKRQFKKMGPRLGLQSFLVETVDLGYPLNMETLNESYLLNFHLRSIRMGLAKLKSMDPLPSSLISMERKALVVGGGIAGMAAALGIADHGYMVDLVEKTESLGGNLKWIKHTLDGSDTKEIQGNYLSRIEEHPNINVHTKTMVIDSMGQLGHFYTTLENSEKELTQIGHGVTILATGIRQAETNSYEMGKSNIIITQKELEEKIDKGGLDYDSLSSVVLIQCVDSREGGRNYCSRICCSSSLKNALFLKDKNPELSVYILYRDMMTYGFQETYYTMARNKGIIFIQYTLERKPRVVVSEDGHVAVDVFEPIIGKNLQIEADCLVLATGMLPNLTREQADLFNVQIDPYGFCKEADPKWRPADTMNAGVFVCGAAHSPRSLSEAAAGGQAAAMRALTILSHDTLTGGKIVAEVREGLCSLCARCVDSCPYGARSLDIEEGAARVNPVICQGCGTCAVVCPNSASVLQGFDMRSMLEVIDTAVN